LAGPVRRFVADLPGLGFLKRANRVIDFGKNLIGGESQQTKAEKKAVEAIIGNMQRGGANLTEQQIEDMNKRRKQTIEQYLKETEAMNKAGKAMDEVYDARLDELEAISGKTRPELELLAKEMGVNLYDSTLKFNDVLKKLGLGMAKTADQVRQAFTDTFVEELSFEQIKKQLNAPLVYDEIAEGFKQQILSPEGATLTQGVDFLSQISRATLDATGGNPIAAAFDMAKQLGYKGKQGTAFGTGGVFAGMNLPPQLAAILDQQIGSTLGGFKGTAAQQITDLFTEKGLSVNRQAITAQIGNMSIDQQEKLFGALQNGTFDISNFAGEGGARRTGVQAGTSLLGSFGFSGIEVQQRGMEAVDRLANTMAEQTPEFVEAVKQFVSKTDTVFANISTPPWLKAAPTWWGGAAIPVISNDTRMPRGGGIGDTTSSRLAVTMARHNAINSNIPGKRLITSAYRTYALGSSNSDHVTGRALDLVGANLGQYRRDIMASGGFAEFHGRGASRHLHVVPGPGAGGIGDTAVPVMSRPMTSGGGSRGSVAGSSYVININGSNASPEEIANRVMAKIEMKERSERQRS
jgi:hypothetical protein